MNTTRRRALQTAFGTGLLAMAPHRRAAGQSQGQTVSSEELLRVAECRCFRSASSSRRRITAMELLRNGANFSSGSAPTTAPRAWLCPTPCTWSHTYPIFLNRVAPFFIGKDARQLEPLLWELYRHDDNYKYQGLALWVCVAAAEFAILDLLGKQTGKSIGDLLGGVKRREIAVYRASGIRGNTPEEEIAVPQANRRRDRRQALKFRVGGRMSKNADSLPGRTERLIPLVRETFGPEMTLYADSNSSYDAAQGDPDRPADGEISITASSRSPAGSTIWRRPRRWPTR